MNHVTGYFYSRISLQCPRTLPYPLLLLRGIPYREETPAQLWSCPPAVTTPTAFTWGSSPLASPQQPATLLSGQIPGKIKTEERADSLRNRRGNPRQKGERPRAQAGCKSWSGT